MGVILWIMGVCFGMALIKGETFDIILSLIITLVLAIMDIIRE